MNKVKIQKGKCCFLTTRVIIFIQWSVKSEKIQLKVSWPRINNKERFSTYLDMLAEHILTEHVRNFSVSSSTVIDTARVKAGYDDVRSDYTETQWAVFKYVDATITLAGKGKNFEDFKREFEDNERCYGYIRFQTGDEMSKRTKFILVTWIGKDVGVMHRAKVTSDKSLVKQVILNYAVEFQLETHSEIDEKYFKEELTKIGGTKYGTGVIKS